MWQLTRAGMCSRFLLILLLLSFNQAIITFNELNCLDLSATSGCACTYERNLSYIECPAFRVDIGTNKENRDFVDIKCKQLDKIENNLLPKMYIGNRYEVNIFNCELAGETIVHMLEQLGIQNVKGFFLSGNKLKSNFTRLLTELSALKELRLDSNYLTLLPADFFVDLSNITELTIKESLFELPLQVFDPLENLTKLDISYNFLRQLPEKIFHKQRKLKALNLSHNQLRNLSKTDFESATFLQSLDLSCNNIDHFEPDIFSQLTSLSEVYIGCNDFRVLPSTLFANNKNLTILNIRFSKLLLLPSALFASLPHLQEVHITCRNYPWSTSTYFKLFKLENRRRLIYTGCGLRDIPSDLITVTSNWTYIVLAGNKMRLLPDRLFVEQNNLNLLDLSHNKLQSLQHGLFGNKNSLSLLDLTYNQLTKLSVESFLTLSSLERLYLDNNKLDFLPDELFNKTTNLIELKLSFNELNEISHEIFTALVKLEVLYLDNNKLLILPVGLFNRTSNMNQLKLSYNQLHKLSAAIFTPLFKLKELHLDNNQLHLLPDGLFRETTQLLKLNLSHNQLTELSANIFSSLIKLKELYMNNNQLQLLPKGLFRQNNELVKLKLSQNQLYEITAEIFSPLVKLEELNLENNHIKKIDHNAFSRTRNIRFINMENNQYKLQELHNDQELKQLLRVPIQSPFHLLEKLQTLKLRNNSVQHISSDWRLLPELKVLELSFNNITTIDYRDFKFQQNGLLVNISHNQVHTLDFDGENLLLFDVIIDLSYNPLYCDCKLTSFLLYLRRKAHTKKHFVTDNLHCDIPDVLRLRAVSDLNPVDLLCLIEESQCPLGCTCWERNYDATLIVNCTNTNLAELPVLPFVQTIAFKAIELHIDNSALLKLPTISQHGHVVPTKIYASHNNISQIALHNLPKLLTYLDLTHNNLQRLDPDVLNFFNRSHSLIQLMLAGNPWVCDCASRPLSRYAERSSIIADYEEMFCATPRNVTIHDFFIDNNSCQEDHRVLITTIVSISFISLLITLSAALYYKYKIELKIWMYRYPCLRRLVSEHDVYNKKKYDAFISYSHKDQEFVGTHLVPELEQVGPIRFKLCVYVRDFVVGEYIVDEIVRAIDESRRTIIVLSKQFIQSVWASMEFRLAHQAAIDEGHTRVILIMYEDIGDIDSLDPILRAYLKTNTYLEWGDPWFWHRLRYAMPHSENSPPDETYKVISA